MSQLEINTGVQVSYPATARQLALIAKLRTERAYFGKLGPNPENITKEQASKAISWLLAQPKAEPVALDPTLTNPDQDTEIGYYTKVSGWEHTDLGFGVAKVIPNSEETFTYARIWDQVEEAWIKFPGGKRVIRTDGWEPATPGQVSRFGHVYLKCVFCNLALTDDRSKTAGYGKKCASNQGLPWGAVDLVG